MHYIRKISIDILLFSCCYVTAILIRFDISIPSNYVNQMIIYFPMVILIRISTFFLFKIYNNDYTYVSIPNIFSILKAISLSSILLVLIHLCTPKFFNFPLSVLIIDWYLVFFSICGVRYLITRWRKRELINFKNRKSGERVLIMGAGDAAESILREIKNYRHYNYIPVGLIDDNPQKQRKIIQGVKVLGTSKNIAQLINNKKIKALIIAIPSATKNQINSILDNCKDLKVKILLVPYLYEINTEKLLINQLQEIKPEAILFRESITWDDKNLVQEITGKRILVTGAGGSIGSELCRQILKYNLKELLLFERSEYNLFRITNELKKAFPNSVLYPCIADLVDYEITSKIIKKFQPDIIFHAAAYKHLFLMEINPESAIKNNIIGTVNLTRIAIDTHVNKLVLISTDKAVNPTCIMGATKRICEEYIRATAKLNGKIFFGVRFGNVLDSSGSVLQIFKEQISQGGPVTVTDINVYRYFMTIPEAAHLVLQTPSFATGGEIFILDMGKPVRIYDLAKKLIDLCDLEVDKDIDIAFTGLKPGEKLNEELFEKNEKLEITPHKKILKIENNGNIINLNRLNKDIDQLVRYSNEMNQKAIFQKMEEMIPTFQASVTQNFNLVHIENDN